MYSIHVSDKKMSFSSAHFVLGSDYCEALHGHNYTVEVTIYGELDSTGMVLDFGDVKKRVLHVCKTLDHRVLLPGQSQSINVQKQGDSYEVLVQGKRYVFPQEDCVVLPSSATTAELLAEYIAGALVFERDLGVKVCVSENLGTKGCFEKKR